ncbi:hypothetical protein Tco_1076063 [Tanacetum coccineum]
MTAIKEAKDLATLALDELIGNLKIFEMVLDNDGVGSKTTKEKVKPLALKANITRGQTNNNSTCQDESNDDEEIDLMAKNIGKLSQIGVNVHEKFDICKVKTKGGERSRHERECYNCCNTPKLGFKHFNYEKAISFAKSERMVESGNLSPQQPPQAHAIETGNDVSEHVRLKFVIIRVLAGQTVRLAVMADVSVFFASEPR